MTERLTRNFVGMLFWTGFAGLMLFATSIVVTANYEACKTSFELLNYETVPLGKDTLLGWLFKAFLPKATLAQLSALAISLTVAAGIFILFHLAFHLWALLEDRHQYVTSGDRLSASIATWRVARSTFWLLLFLTFIGFAVYWDIQLFRYRSVADALNLVDDPTLTARTLQDWDLQMKSHRDLFAWSIARWGAWGNLGVTAVAAAGLEFSFHKIGDSWTQVLGSFSMVDSQPVQESEPIVYGYLADGQPVYDPKAPVAYDPYGRPVDSIAQEPNEEVPVNGNAPRDGETWFVAPEENEAAEGQRPVGIGTRSMASPANQIDPVYPVLLNVVGGSTGEQVTLADAIAQPERYWVDPDTHEVWSVEYREHLFGNPALAA